MRETLDIEIKKRLDALKDTIDRDVAAALKSVGEETTEISKEYTNWWLGKDENGISLKDKVERTIERKDELTLRLTSGTLKLEEEIEVANQLTSINEWLLKIDKQQKAYYSAGAHAKVGHNLRYNARKNAMQNKLEELVEAIEKEIAVCKRKKAAFEQLQSEDPEMYFDTEVKKLDSNMKILNSYLEAAQLMVVKGPIFAQAEVDEIVKGLNGKDKFTDNLFSTYINAVREYGKLSKEEIEEKRNTQTPPSDDDDKKKTDGDDGKKKEDDDDGKKKDDDIIDINDYDLNIEEAPQMPKNISQKPEKTWKTVAAVALGIGAAAGVFATFGVVGAGVVFVASGIARKFIKKKEKTIKEEEQKLQEYAQKIEDYNNQSEDIRKTITQFVEKYNTTDDEEMKKAIKAKIDEFRGNLARNNEFVAGEKAKMEEIVKRIYPDLKADEYNGPQKITSIEDAKEKIKAKGRKFKAYLGSKEGLRDARWFMNAAQITSAALVAVDFVSGLANPSVTNSVVQTPPTETITPPGETVVDIPTEPGLYDGISVGGDVSGYNLSVGHDTASWALDGTNTESLISEYVNSTNSIFKGFRIQSGNGTIPLDLKGMNLTEFLNANPGIDPSTIVADVASKDGISQAWVSIDELVSGLGGKSL